MMHDPAGSVVYDYPGDTSRGCFGISLVLSTEGYTPRVWYTAPRVMNTFIYRNRAPSSEAVKTGDASATTFALSYGRSDNLDRTFGVG